MTWEALDDIPAILARYNTDTWTESMVGRSRTALLLLREAVTAARAGARGGRLVIWRAVNVFQLRDITWDNLGCCWTHAEQSAHAYYGTHAAHRQRRGDFDPMRVRLRATVALDDVDWDATFYLHVENPPEREVRLKPGAVVEVDGGVYYAVTLRRWVPLQIKRSFRARVHELDRGYGWTPLPRRRR